MLSIVLLTLAGLGLTAYAIDEIRDDDADDDPGRLTQEGTPGDDRLEGTGINDALIGLGGDDILLGLQGSDGLRAGSGDDIVLAGAGDDEVTGAQGGDLLLGEAGDDTVAGDLGLDWVEGGSGADSLGGGGDDDLVIGGDGADTILGDGGNDALFNGDLLARALTEEELVDVRETVQAGGTIDFPADAAPAIDDDGTADVLRGGAGDDALYIGDGDTAEGGEGADDFFLLDGQALDPAQVTDFDTQVDQLIYVYDAVTAPDLALSVNDDGTQTLTADGAAAAILAADRPLLLTEVMLMQRGTPGSGVL